MTNQITTSCPLALTLHLANGEVFVQSVCTCSGDSGTVVHQEHQFWCSCYVHTYVRTYYWIRICHIKLGHVTIVDAMMIAMAVCTVVPWSTVYFLWTTLAMVYCVLPVDNPGHGLLCTSCGQPWPWSTVYFLWTTLAMVYCVLPVDNPGHGLLCTSCGQPWPWSTVYFLWTTLAMVYCVLPVDNPGHDLLCTSCGQPWP